MDLDKPILFVSDIDGTLLKNRWEVSEKNKLTIQKALAYKKGKNFKFALATGRPISHINQVLSNLDLENKEVYLVACNGSIVFDGQKQQEISVSKIDKLVVKKVIAILKKYTNFINIHTINNSFRTGDSKIINAFEAWTKYATKHIDDLEKIEDEEVCKITSFVFSKNKAEAANKELEEEIKDSVSLLHTKGRLFEIMPPMCNKLIGIQKLQRHLKIDDSQVIVVGDNENDVPMLEYYNNSYVVKNSHEKAISVAKNLLEDTNKEDAIANLILKILN